MNNCGGIKILDLPTRKKLTQNEYLVIAERGSNYKVDVKSLISLVGGVSEDVINELKAYIDNADKSLQLQINNVRNQTEIIDGKVDDLIDNFYQYLKRYIDNDTIYADDEHKVIKAKGGSGPSTKTFDITVTLSDADNGSVSITGTEVLKEVVTEGKYVYTVGAVALGEWNIPEGQPSKPLRKATLSLGWTADELNNQGVIYDKDLKLNKVNFSVNVRFFVWDSEETSGTIQKIDSYGFSEDVQKIGQVTGDDSGIFPDDVLLRAIRYNGNPTNTYGYRRVQITLDPGHYNLRLFMSLNKTQKDGSKFLKIQTIIDDVTTDFTIPEDYSLSGNLTRWLEQEIHITESGKFELRFGFENVTIGWVPCPLNVMEIEEI